MEQKIRHYLKKHGFEAFTPKAVLFDMDGVLYNSMPNHAVAWHNAMAKFGIEMTHEDAYATEGQRGVDTIRQMVKLQQGRNISQEEALRTMTAELGDDPVKFAGVNPFQAEIEILLQAGYANSDSLARLTTTMTKDTRVIDVIYAKDQIDAVDRNIQRINLFLIVLVILHIFICFTLVNNSVQLGIYSRRFTIHTMKLVGAKWSFIRHPFLWRSIGIGFVASLLACAVLGAGVYSFYRYQAD